MIRIKCVVAACVVLIVAASQASAISVTNGDFSAGLAGWTTVGPVSDGGGFALLEEDPVLAVTSLEQQIVVPAGSAWLVFDLGLSSTPDSTTGFPFPDGFAASLLDPVTFAPILSTSGFTDYFYEDRAGLRDFDPNIVNVSGNTVRLDLSSVSGGTGALIVFDLLGGNDGFATQATVDNVDIVAIPEPLTIIGVPMAMAGLVGYFRRRGLKLVA